MALRRSVNVAVLAGTAVFAARGLAVAERSDRTRLAGIPGADTVEVRFAGDRTVLELVNLEAGPND